jgi:integrase
VASAYITTRTTQTGKKRFVVRYRLHGGDSKVRHAGSFKTMREAKLRRDLVGGELARGNNPAERLSALFAEPVKARTFAEVAEAYRVSRLDLAAETTKNLGSHLKAILPTFEDRDPATITFQDVQAWVAGLELKASSVRRYTATLRLILDYAGVDPNPARDGRVRLPTIVTEEPQPPTAKQFLAILDKTPTRWRLPFVLIEQTGMTVGEASSLAWGDVDVAGSKVRLRRANVKAGIRSRARWPQVPEWLMELIEETCPFEDRTAERRVFPGFTSDVGKNLMARACVAAGIPHFHPHDLRHRRLSLWHGQGVPAKELAERAGHARASMTLDVYSHVMPLDEASQEDLVRMLSEQNGGREVL